MSGDAELKAIVDRVVSRARLEHEADRLSDAVLGRHYAHDRHGRCIDPLCPDFGTREHGHHANEQRPQPFLRPAPYAAFQMLKAAALKTPDGRFVERVVCYVLDTLTRALDWFTRKVERR